MRIPAHLRRKARANAVRHVQWQREVRLNSRLNTIAGITEETLRFFEDRISLQHLEAQFAKIGNAHHDA